DTVPDECITCATSNRKCEENGGAWICTACMDAYYEDDHVCKPKNSVGAVCDDATFTGADCLSGNCVDGVCCDSDCTGLCSACNIAALEGTCSPIPADTDPADECAPAGASTCGTTGMCDGAGACALYDATTVCKDANCTDATHSEEAAFCDGDGACDDGALNIANCSPNACDNATGTCIAGSCGDNDDCDANYFCNLAGDCQLDLGLGQKCTGLGNDACVTGDCTEDNFPETPVDSYCVPNTPAHCAYQGSWFTSGAKICYDTIGYKQCSPDLWSFAFSCPQNSDKSACTASGWDATSGYIPIQQVCNDGNCVTSTSCTACRITRIVGLNERVTSYFHFNTSTKECYTTCTTGGTPPSVHHEYCSQSTKLNFYCSYNDRAYGRDYNGLCVPQKEVGKECENNYECQTGNCSGKIKKYCGK
ncbi:hypothetical protein KAH37_07080, partial [bacterium]|nr:hypothetical protein [bacterium]